MAWMVFSTLKQKSKPSYSLEVQIIANDPLIRVVDNFFTNKECNWIINKARGKIKRAVVSSASKGVESSGRTGSVAWFSHDDDPLLDSLTSRVAELADLPLEYSESLQVLHYGPEQHYRTHWDAYDLTTERGMRCCSDKGQRIRTALAYLNDVPAGGHTKFPRLNVEVEPRMGRIVVFDNCIINSIDRHPDALHAATPVITGEKWAITLFFRDRPYKKSN
ncbi:MAG: 2OG-Fe(II) oxygenase [Magnetococcales bacterium]|nr:2OG-Fe(II) oxygenase [Magnetococcales bacterium]